MRVISVDNETPEEDSVSVKIAPRPTAGRLTCAVALLVVATSLVSCGPSETGETATVVQSEMDSPPDEQTAVAAPRKWQAPTPGPPVEHDALARLEPAAVEQIARNVAQYDELVSQFGGRVEVHLNFAGSQITDADLARLEFPLAVRGIDLSRTSITDQGVAELLRAKGLERIVLTNTPVTDRSLEYFQQMPNLLHTDLDQSKVSVEGQLELLRLLTSRAQARLRSGK
jgi:hypothetical protein